MRPPLLSFIDFWCGLPFKHFSVIVCVWGTSKMCWTVLGVWDPVSQPFSQPAGQPSLAHAGDPVCFVLLGPAPCTFMNVYISKYLDQCLLPIPWFTDRLPSSRAHPTCMSSRLVYYSSLNILCLVAVTCCPLCLGGNFIQWALGPFNLNTEILFLIRCFWYVSKNHSNTSPIPLQYHSSTIQNHYSTIKTTSSTT